MSEPDTIELEYEFSPDDYVRMLYHAARGSLQDSRKARRRRLARVTVASFLLTELLFFGWQSADLKPICVLAGLGAAWFLASALGLSKILLRNKVRRRPGLAGPRRVVIASTHIESYAEYGVTVMSWLAISRIDVEFGDIFFASPGRLPLMIPPSAFASQAEAEAVYRIAERRLSEASVVAAYSVNEASWPPAPLAHAEVDELPACGPEIDSSQCLALQQSVSRKDLILLAVRISALGAAVRALVIAAAISVVYVAFGVPLTAIAVPAIGVGAFGGILCILSTMRLTLLTQKRGEPDAWTHRFVTDYRAIRIEARGIYGVMSPKVVAGSSIAFGQVLMEVGLGQYLIHPVSAFGSPAAAREFVRRIRAAAKEAEPIFAFGSDAT
ncbi:MAG: hypothetical protein P4L33_20325 [Capsulimonadaceae bacterium]|nr:hypothetical protein [Capsulimonadaceae bacterium]